MSDVPQPSAEFRALLPATIRGPGFELVSTTGARIRSPRKHGYRMVIPRSHTGGIHLGAKPVSRCRNAARSFAQRPDGD
jgi:hypothetical protein